MALLVTGGRAAADAPALFCVPSSNKRLVPVCPATAVGGLFPVNYLSGFSEQAPGNPSADSATRAWRSYGEVFSTYGGNVIWIDVFGSQCAASAVFDPGNPPDFAKLVTFSTATIAGNHPELISVVNGTTFVAAGVSQQFCFLSSGIDISTGRIPGSEVISSCHQPAATEQFVWLHELGHMYGVDHLDTTPSTMNTFTSGVYSCSSRIGRPIAKADGETMATIYNAYYRGRRPNAIDIGGSPFVGMNSLLAAVGTRAQTIPVSRRSNSAVSGAVQFMMLNLKGNVVGPVNFRVLFEPMANSYSPSSNGDFVPSTAAVVANAGVQFLGPLGPPGFEYWKTGNHLLSVNWNTVPSQLLAGFTYWMVVEMEPLGSGYDVDPMDNRLILPVRLVVLP